MNYSVEVLSDLPVMLVRFEAAFGTAEDIESYIQEVKSVYSNLDRKVYDLTDVTKLDLSFVKVMEFLRVVLRSENRIPENSMRLGSVVITTSHFQRAMIKGLRSATFGNIQIEVFDSLDAALTWVRAQAA